MTQQHYGTGRRKTSTARVFLKPGTGKITVYQRDLNDYFGRVTGRTVVRQPLERPKPPNSSTSTSLSPVVVVPLKAGAIRHGITRALMAYNEDFPSGTACRRLRHS